MSNGNGGLYLVRPRDVVALVARCLASSPETQERIMQSFISMCPAVDARLIPESGMRRKIAHVYDDKFGLRRRRIFEG